MHLCASCCNATEWISVQTETIPFVIATNIHADFYLCANGCVFTSAMLELHLLFIGVLLGFDISTVPEKEKHSWIMIPYINQTARNRLFLAAHRHQYSFMACLWKIIYTWVFVYMCNCTQEFDILNLWYFQEHPVLHRAQPIAVCMNKQIFPFVSTHPLRSMRQAWREKHISIPLSLCFYLSIPHFPLRRHAWGWVSVCVCECV